MNSSMKMKTRRRHDNHYKAHILDHLPTIPPTTNLTSPILIIPVKRLQNPKRVNASSQNNKHVEYLMRAPPDIKASWIELLRDPRDIDQGADEGDPTLSIVIREAGLFVELLERE